MKKRLVLLGSAFCVAALVLSACGETATEGSGSAQTPSSGTSESSSPSASEPVDTAESGSSFVDGVLTTPMMKIEITDHKVIPVGKKGNEYGTKPVIAFWYSTTNLTAEDVSPMDFLLVMRAFQDTNPDAENELNVAGLPDDEFLDSQMENIKQGGTVKNAVAYELDDLKIPVVLVASNDLGMTEIGKATFDLK